MKEKKRIKTIISIIMIGTLLIPFLTINTNALTSTVFTGVTVDAAYPAQRKLVRQSNGTLWCAFHENNDVHVAFSIDLGVTWNDIEVWSAETSTHPSLAVDSNDVVHLVFHSYKNDANDFQLEYSNSTDWSTIVQIRDEDKHHQYPSIAVDSNDNLHITYEKGEEGASNDDQVAYINSTNNGGDWGTEQIITNEPDIAEDEWYPSIAINGTNGIHVVYQSYASIAGFQEIDHVSSNDYGATWTNWTADPVYQDAAKHQRYPCIAIDDNNELHVTWHGIDQNVKTQIGYSYNDSSGWKAVEWITWDPSLGYQYPTISVNDNNYVHTAYEVLATRLNHSVNDTIISTENTIFNGDYNFPNMISTYWPVSGGLKTNRPNVGYAFICAFSNTNITYYSSNNLNWGIETINISKTGNTSTVDYINSSLGVNVNFTYTIRNTGDVNLTNITVNETWFDCSCSDWNYTFISTNLTAGISNITWYNSSCYAIINITNLSVGECYAFNMIINITECVANTSGYLINYANVSTVEGATSSGSHSIRWETETLALRVQALRQYVNMMDIVEPIITIIGVVLVIAGILTIVGLVYMKRW